MSRFIKNVSNTLSHLPHAQEEPLLTPLMGLPELPQIGQFPLQT